LQCISFPAGLIKISTPYKKLDKISGLEYVDPRIRQTRGNIMQNTALIIDTRSGNGLTTDHLASYVQSIDASASTIASYGGALKRLFAYLQQQGITHPDADDLRGWKRELLATAKPNTAQLYITAARQFFAYLSERGLYQDIARNLKGVKVTRGFKKDYLTPDQVVAVCDNAACLRDRAMLTLMFTTGIRCCEVVRADIADLRPAGDSPALYVQRKGQLEANQYVKLSPRTDKILREYIASRGKVDDNQPLFTSDANRNKGQRLTTMSISRICKTTFRAAGYDSPRLTAHSTRHTAATLNALAGASSEENQQLLGHRDAASVRFYDHAASRIKNNSEARIEAMIWGNPAGR